MSCLEKLVKRFTGTFLVLFVVTLSGYTYTNTNMPNCVVKKGENR